MSLPQALENALKPVTIIAGHYGVGKTNLSLNIALDAAQGGKNVKLVDLDVVNPYFRSCEYTDLLQQSSIEVIAPVLANSSVDVPSLSAGVYGAIEWAQIDSGNLLIIDAGGDDVGATALGRFTPHIKRSEYAMLYVVNMYRNLTQAAADALEILQEIEIKSGLKASGIINNSHLKNQTQVSTITDAQSFGLEVADAADIPFVVQTAPNMLFDRTERGLNLNQEQSKFYPVDVIVKTPWE
jgi:hypothetical protein